MTSGTGAGVIHKQKYISLGRAPSISFDKPPREN